MSNIWAIPDIHGRNDLLQPLLKKLFDDEKFDLFNDKLIFLGDMIDRGKDSKGVLDTIKDLCEKHPNNVIALQGNHEELMVSACTRATYDDFYLWQINGGDATQNSFLPNRKVPDDYIRWVASLPLAYKEPGFFFSHAYAPAENTRLVYLQGQEYNREELTWSRTGSEKEEQEFSNDFGNGVVGVCGHNHALSYKPGPIMEPRFYDHYIFADAGCGCYKKAPLVAIECKTRKVLYEWPIEAQGSTNTFCATKDCSKPALEWNSRCKDHWYDDPRNY